MKITDVSMDELRNWFYVISYAILRTLYSAPPPRNWRISVYSDDIIVTWNDDVDN